ncbi:mechanosensitive ion channel domain-containing protein [Ottowia sp.]|uniref:mechanosensitive ion channel domain-containing protein n=1 Tax=Ottowia sp. TaxID=1898956 RepID=UPI003A8BF299
MGSAIDPAADPTTNAITAIAPAANTPTSLSTQIDSLTAQVAASELTDEQKTQAQDALKSASAALASAATMRDQATTLRSQTRQTNSQSPVAPADPTDVAEQFAQWQTRMHHETSIATLERLLADERNASTQLRQQVDQLSASLSALLTQPAQISDTLVTLQQRSDQLVNPEPAASPTAASPPLVQRAQDVQREAEKVQVNAEINLRRTQQDTAGARQNALQAQLQTLQQALAHREPRAAWLNQRIAQLSRQKLVDQAAAAQAAAEQLGKQGPPALADLARSNAQLAQQVMDDSAALTSDREQLTSDEQSREQISAVLRDAQARLNLSGNSAVLGHWLWQKRLEMPSLRALERKRHHLLAQLSDLRLRQYALADLRRASVSATTSVPDVDSNVTAIEWAPLRNQQSQLSTQLTPLLSQRVAILEQRDRMLSTMIDRGNQLRTLMDRELLWIPSHPPINLKWLHTLPQQLVAGLKGIELAAAGRTVASDARQRPLRYIAYALLLVALWRLRRHALQRLRVLAERTRDVLHDSFAHTSQAFAWSCAVSLPWPCAFLGAGFLLRSLNEGHTHDVETFGETLIFLSVMGLVLALLHALIRPDGLAEAHLRWGAARLNHIRRTWLITTCLLVPASFMTVWPLRRGVDIAIDAHARLSAILIGVGIGISVIWLLRRERLWPNMPDWLHRILLFTIPAGYFFCALAAMVGYVFSSVVLIEALLKSAMVVVLAQTAYGMLDRWLLLSERALALKARQRAHQHGGDVVDQESGAATRADDSAALELVTVSEQGRRLLKVVRICLMLVGLIWAWGEVAPALMRFDAINLWHFSDKGADGKAIIGTVTASDLMLALLISALTFSLVRNIPGLVELALSASRRITASTRYTTTMLLRYSTVMLGTISALGLLGIRWSQLQWMAAALTVGLGFGLQEIFANFVSGLILLVERPFRVGDTITIDTISGTVTRIRTRATVVQDFDNKENIIPNKTFITGQVINWTLSDEVTRVTLPIGVAYGSPVPRVHELLQQIALEQPVVLKEPPPQSWFMAFGASSLDFELRIYVDGPGNRLPVQNAILGRIAELFAAEGIEIAFPQMDVHVRDWPGDTAPPVIPSAPPPYPAQPSV